MIEELEQHNNYKDGMILTTCIKCNTKIITFSLNHSDNLEDGSGLKECLKCGAKLNNKQIKD